MCWMCVSLLYPWSGCIQHTCQPPIHQNYAPTPRPDACVPQWRFFTVKKKAAVFPNLHYFMCLFDVFCRPLPAGVVFIWAVIARVCLHLEEEKAKAFHHLRVWRPAQTAMASIPKRYVDHPLLVSWAEPRRVLSAAFQQMTKRKTI